MANELFCYQLFKNILAASKTIEGRFVVLHGVAADVNTTNFAQMVTDALDTQQEEKKYPCVVLSPPYETQINNDLGWSRYRFDMYFLTLHQRTGDGDIKEWDMETNLSNHTKEEDWKDMREVAGNFRKKLREIIRVPPLPSTIREIKGANDTYYRVTYKMSDMLNGVKVVFDLELADDSCQLADYDIAAVIEIPETSPHPLHKQ